MIILDTNVVSELFKPEPEPNVVTWICSLSEDVAITTVTYAELLAGVQRLPTGRRKAELGVGLNQILHSYASTGVVLPFDVAAAKQYADVLERRFRNGTPISTADAQIAAICLTHEATCATRNVKDFMGTGVSVIDPWDL